MVPISRITANGKLTIETIANGLGCQVRRRIKERPRVLAWSTLRSLAVDIGFMNFHQAVRGAEWFEPILLVQSVRISSRQQDTTEALQVGMFHDVFHESLGEPFAAVPRNDVNIRKECERGLVCYDACKADLLILMENGEAQGIRNCAFDNGAWNAGRPVRLREEAVDPFYIEAALIAGKFV